MKILYFHSFFDREYRLEFSKSQTEAIEHKDGPALVLAGPGSGKTAVITERTSRLITEHGVDPSRILVITFTRAAAREMQERFIQRMGKHYPVTFGTFHAVFFTVLKYAYHFHAGNIIREDVKYQYMREIVTHMGLEYDDEAEFLSSIFGEISMVKNAGVPLENYYSANLPEHVFRKVYRAYDDRLRRSRLLDFDDMLVYTYELFSQRKDILSAWQKKYRYILIDEFQDINKLQFDIMKMLALPENNLFVVGDDDQSIYRFRGAKPELMLHFDQDYPDVKKIVLKENYRSTADIVNASLRLIGHNTERFEKEIQAAGSSGMPVQFSVYEDQRAENKKIIDEILAYVQEGGSYADIAILFRTNTQPRLLMEQLMDYNIPFITRDNIPNLYEHWIAKDIFAYIHMAQGSRTRRNFLQVMNRPKRYISRENVDEEEIAFDVLLDIYRDKPWIAERIEKLECDLKVIGRITPFAAINYIRQSVGYDEFCREYADYRRISEEELFEKLDELQEGAKGYRDFDAWFTHIEEYTKELKRQSEKQRENKNGVLLATLHSAKGLEFRTVYIVDVNEGLMPYKKAVLEADVEEERRMFYVGITRAKEKLKLCSVKKLNNHETEISRFIREMNETGA